MTDKKDKPVKVEKEIDWKKEYVALAKRHNDVLETLGLYGLNIQIFCKNSKIR